MNSLGKLEHDANSELDNAIRQGNIAVFGKRGGWASCRSDIDVRQVTTSGDAKTRIWMIQHVESLGTQLQLEVFENVDVLEHAHVQLIEDRTAQVVAR